MSQVDGRQGHWQRRRDYQGFAAIYWSHHTSRPVSRAYARHDLRDHSSAESGVQHGAGYCRRTVQRYGLSQVRACTSCKSLCQRLSLRVDRLACKAALSIKPDLGCSTAGFAMLRNVAKTSNQPKVEAAPVVGHTNPVYVEGYGFVPPSQVLLSLCDLLTSAPHVLACPPFLTFLTSLTFLPTGYFSFAGR